LALQKQKLKDQPAGRLPIRTAANTTKEEAKKTSTPPQSHKNKRNRQFPELPKRRRKQRKTAAKNKEGCGHWRQESKPGRISLQRIKHKPDQKIT